MKVVNKHILDRLEVDDATRTRLRLVAIVRETAFCPVEHEPALLPGPDTAAHLCQVAAATDRRHGKVCTLVDRVTGGHDKLQEVKTAVTHWQITGQRSCLSYRQKTSALTRIMFKTVKQYEMNRLHMTMQ